MKYVIYKIVDKNNETQFYIGSTNRLCTRRSHHKKNIHNKVGKKYWCKLYQYIRANGGWSNFTMTVIEEVESIEPINIKVKEQEYINNLKPTLNSISAHKENIKHT